MDVATKIGIIVELALLTATIKINGQSWQPCQDFASLLIVLSGTLAATLINYQLHEVLGVFRVGQDRTQRQGTT